MGHCVATYESSINCGSCGISHVDSGTLEIRECFVDKPFGDESIRAKELYINQYKGIGNSYLDPSRIRAVVEAYNKKQNSFVLIENFT